MTLSFCYIKLGKGMAVVIRDAGCANCLRVIVNNVLLLKQWFFFFKPLISLQGGTTFARDLNKIGKRLIVENKRESYPLNIVWMWGKGSPPIASFNFLQFLARIITYSTYLILCGFHEYFKTVGFFKVPHVIILTKNWREWEDLNGRGSTWVPHVIILTKNWIFC